MHTRVRRAMRSRSRSHDLHVTERLKWTQLKTLATVNSSDVSANREMENVKEQKA